MRRCGLFGLILAWCLLGGSPASAQVGVSDVEQASSGAVDAVTSTADDAGKAADDSVGDAVDSVGDAVDSVGGAAGSGGSATDSAGGAAQSAGDSVKDVAAAGGSTAGSVAGAGSGAGTSGSGGGGSTTNGSASSSGDGPSRQASREGGRGERAAGPRTQTRFDRLPRRVEALLERIELGRNVAGNLRRLERVLEGASPKLRARVLRLIRAEIERLERGGTTGSERRRIERLRRVLDALINKPATAFGPTAETTPVVSTASRTESAPVNQSATDGGALGAEAAGPVARPQPPIPPAQLFPPDDGEFPRWLGFAAILVLALAIARIATHLGRPGAG